MKVGETITITREVNGSTGYGVYLVLLENLALAGIDIDQPKHPLLPGAPVARHFTFQAVKAGTAKVQFASYRPWRLPEADYEPVISIDVEAADEAEAADAAAFKAGGWTPFAQPDHAALAAFKEAFSHLVGVGYEPLLATSQVVNGVYYIFLTEAQVVYPGAAPYSALVRVYKPVTGPARIIKIAPLSNPNHPYGGYTAFRKAGPEDQAILKAATQGLMGGGYAGDYVSTQVVAGVNYRFAGTETLTTKDPVKFPVLFTIYQPPSGKPTFTGAKNVYDLV